MSRYPSSLDRDWVWVLSLDVRGDLIRWTSRPIPDTVSGMTGLILPGLDPDVVTEALDVAKAEFDRVDTLSFQVHFPPEFDPAALAASGVALTACDAELALLPTRFVGDVTTSSGTRTRSTPSTTPSWDDRYVILSGYISEPEFGDADEPVTFSVRATTYEDESSIPGPTQVVDPTTVGAGSLVTVERDDSYGSSYPLVFGQPGVFVGSDGATSYRPATPGYVFEGQSGAPSDADKWEKILVSAGHTQADRVHLWWEADPGFNSVEVALTKGADNLGQPITYIDASKGTGGAVLDKSKYWVDWRDDSLGGDGGGVVDGPGSGDLSGVGSLCVWLLRQSTIPVDWARMSGAVAFLDEFRFGGVIETPTSALDWIEDRVLGDLPAFLGRSPAGVYLAPIRWQATASEAVARLVEGEGTVVRMAPARTRGNGRTTVVRVEWARDLAADEWARTTVVTADPRLGTFAMGTGLVQADRSVAPRVVKVQLPDCWDEATAYRVATWTLWREGTAHVEIDVDLSADTYGHLQVGDVVTYGDAGLHLGEGTVCLVTAIDRHDVAWLEARLWVVRPEVAEVVGEGTNIPPQDPSYVIAVGGSSSTSYAVTDAGDVGTYAEQGTPIVTSFEDTRAVRYIYDQDVYLVGGEFGALAWSLTGAAGTWTRIAPGSNDLNRICEGTDLVGALVAVVAVGESGRILTCTGDVTDAGDWSQQTIGSTTWYDVAHDGDGTFVAVGSGGAVITSPDGSTWTSRTFGVGVNVRGVCWDPSSELFIAVGDSGAIRTSPDGVTWTARTSGTTENLYAVAADGEGVVVAVGGTFATTFALTRSASGGVSWATSAVGIAHRPQAVAYRVADPYWDTASGFYAVGAGGLLATSPTGSSWTAQTSGTTAQLFDLHVPDRA
ncbi:MAG: hypothetical protein H6733_10235 [Alphaproteobacteria bacterium]|nr:hypothetical protein [Alphaproteobacteria bacterium]